MKRPFQNSEMAISEGELNSMTAELDMLHKETFPGVRKTLDDFSANLVNLRTKENLGRRAFLGGIGGVALIGGVAACSSSGGGGGTTSTPPTTKTPTSPGTTSSSPTGGGSKYTGDLQVVALAAALENLAVAAYGGALKLASAGKIGKVPPAIGNFITVAMKQHADHASAWNAVLKSAKLPEIKGAPLTITKSEVAMLGKAKSVVDVAKQALSLENAAAETYTFATANVSDAGGIMTAATIQPVETMHAAILNFVLGQYPVPSSFIGVNMAVPPSALTA